MWWTMIYDGGDFHHHPLPFEPRLLILSTIFISIWDSRPRVFFHSKAPEFNPNSVKRQHWIIIIIIAAEISFAGFTISRKQYLVILYSNSCRCLFRCRRQYRFDCRESENSQICNQNPLRRKTWLASLQRDKNIGWTLGQKHWQTLGQKYWQHKWAVKEEVVLDWTSAIL